MNMHDGRFSIAFRVLLAGALLISIHLSTASADPITGIYQIHVFERLVQPAGSEEFVREPFEQQFALILTIDTSSGSEPRPGVRIFGSATFSSVPLEPILGAPNLPFQPGTAASFFVGIGRLLSATSFASTFDPVFFRRAVGLSVTIPASESGAVPEVTDARMFLMLLGQDFGGPAFSYDGETEDGRIRFQGNATLLRIEPAITPDPIPEPATIALVGSGLLLVLRRSPRARYFAPSCENADSNADCASRCIRRRLRSLETENAPYGRGHSVPYGAER